MSTSVLPNRFEEPCGADEFGAVADQPVVQIAATREDRLSAFQLVYQTYRRANLCPPNSFGVRITPHQLLPSTDIFMAKVREDTISTLSLVADSDMGLPLESVFPSEVDQRRQCGLAIGEVGCLADRRKDLRRFFASVVEVMRYMVQSARYRQLDQLLIAVHPRHAKFYQRYMAFERISGERNYPSVCDHRAVALCLDFSMIDRYRQRDYQYFVGTPLPEAQLRPRPISEADRRFFAAMCEVQSHWVTP